jgi:pimeloyl-ACP methyl ester carboxylesterase
MKTFLIAVCSAVVGIRAAGRWDVGAPLRAGEPETQSSGPAAAVSSVLESVPVPTMGGRQFWTDELFFHQWHIQRNAITGRCRLLNGNNLRHALGTYEHCRAVLDGIKQQQKLPPMQGKAVVVLHGLARSRKPMTKLCEYLEQGGYTVFNVGYASTRASIADHAKALAKIIENLDGIDQISFVGQSMGNIVIRHYLADQTDQTAGRRPDPRIQRFVMLGPPNHGSIAATSFSDSKLVKTVLGEPSQELGREWVWLESDLVTPQCEFGIIAGGRGDERGFNPMLPGDNDGVVTVASARLAGARDFVLVPVFHSFLPTSRTVMQDTLSFLQNGYFISEDKRQPIAEE